MSTDGAAAQARARATAKAILDETWDFDELVAGCVCTKSVPCNLCTVRVKVEILLLAFAEGERAAGERVLDDFVEWVAAHFYDREPGTLIRSLAEKYKADPARGSRAPAVPTG